MAKSPYQVQSLRGKSKEAIYAQIRGPEDFVNFFAGINAIRSENIVKHPDDMQSKPVNFDANSCDKATLFLLMHVNADRGCQYRTAFPPLKLKHQLVRKKADGIVTRTNQVREWTEYKPKIRLGSRVGTSSLFKDGKGILSAHAQKSQPPGNFYGSPCAASFPAVRRKKSSRPPAGMSTIFNMLTVSRAIEKRFRSTSLT